MYVRKKFMRRKDKVYGPYWQVVRSVRVDGKPRQRVVANVGAAKNRENADVLARMKGLLCGVWGCGEAATDELTWPLPDRPPVAFTLERERCGALVCPEHLKEWHSSGIGRFAERPRVVPLLYPQERPAKSLL
jgi:hypothetical protein